MNSQQLIYPLPMQPLSTPPVTTTPSAPPNHIAANLRALRKAAGWSQAELAERVGLNRGNIASYESGNAEPNICKTLQISKVFAVHPRDLIRRDLRDAAELTLAKIAYVQDREDYKAELENHQLRTAQLAELLASSRKLFDYKKELLESPCAEAKQIGLHYEQLYQISQELLSNQQLLLERLSCQCDG